MTQTTANGPASRIVLRERLQIRHTVLAVRWLSRPLPLGRSRVWNISFSPATMTSRPSTVKSQITRYPLS